MISVKAIGASMHSDEENLKVQHNRDRLDTIAQGLSKKCIAIAAMHMLRFISGYLRFPTGAARAVAPRASMADDSSGRHVL